MALTTGGGGQVQQSGSDRHTVWASYPPRVIGDRLLEHLADGNLASAAWAGYRRLPSGGLYRIAERVRGV